jgi:toxin FitB
MILLDTNVISEAMKSEPNSSVKSWLNQQAVESLYLSSPTVAELLFGIACLASGRRKQALEKTIEVLLDSFNGRILDFDLNAAKAYSRLAVRAKDMGKGFPLPDGYIAAIAASNDFVIATRDTGPFEAANLKVINPWRH